MTLWVLLMTVSKLKSNLRVTSKGPWAIYFHIHISTNHEKDVLGLSITNSLNNLVYYIKSYEN